MSDFLGFRGLGIFRFYPYMCQNYHTFPGFGVDSVPPWRNGHKLSLSPFSLGILVSEDDSWLNRWVQQKVSSERLPLLIAAGGIVIGRPERFLSSSV